MYDITPSKERPLSHTEVALARFDDSEFRNRVEALEKLSSRSLNGLLQRSNLPSKSRLGNATFTEIAARDYGFDSLSHLESLLVEETSTYETTERAALAAAVVGNENKVKRLLECEDRLLGHSPSIAFCLGLESALDWVSEIEVSKRIGPLGWHPLTYTCCSQASRTRTGATTRRELVARLVKAGANANVGCHESETIRGFLTLLGGAVGCRRDSTLAQQLLESGAEIDDGPTLYEGSAIWYAVKENDAKSMRVLLEAKPPLWHLCHALPHAIDLGEEEIVDQLLSAGADPNWNMTTRGYGGNCLHEAIVVGSSMGLAKKLCDANASVEQHDGGLRTPLAMATALNRTQFKDHLVGKGANLDECGSIEHWVGACFAHDQDRANRLSRSLSTPETWLYEDHLWLCHAARVNDVHATTMLLAGGMNPNAVDYDGNSALHLAAERGNQELCKVLIAAGADKNAINFSGGVPFDCALGGMNFDEELLAVLDGLDAELPDSRLSLVEKDAFEVAATAIPAGDLTTLRDICDANPKFALARSPRPHRCTLLNYVGVNGFEGERQVTPSNILEIMDYLIDEVGCDPCAWTYTYRGGPGNNTIGLLTSSGHPRAQGLTLAMTHKLVKAGAEVDPGWRLLVEMYESLQDGSVETFLSHVDMASRSAIEAFVESANLGYTGIVSSMLSAGIDPNACVRANVRAIHNAAINGDRSMVEILLNAGADPRLRDSQFDGTAAGWADAGGHEELTKWLLQTASSMDQDERSGSQ